MRDIRFRAWDSEHKAMVQCTGCWFEEQGNYHEEDLAKVAAPKVLMQFTGLKDKNGVDVFEGDIVYCERCEYNSEVEWNNKSSMFGFHRPNIHDGYEVDIQCIKVLGNRFEHPELLNETQKEG